MGPSPHMHTIAVAYVHVQRIVAILFCSFLRPSRHHGFHQKPLNFPLEEVVGEGRQRWKRTGNRLDWRHLALTHHTVLNATRRPGPSATPTFQPLTSIAATTTFWDMISFLSHPNGVADTSQIAAFQFRRTPDFCRRRLRSRRQSVARDDVTCNCVSF